MLKNATFFPADEISETVEEDTLEKNELSNKNSKSVITQPASFAIDYIR